MRTRAAGAGCFCSELTAIDNSSSAEILVRLWFGDLKNGETPSFPGCSSLFCGAKQPQQMSWPTSPSRQFKGTQRYHKKQYLSIQQQGASPPLSLQLCLASLD
jgi:hypothetical protein